MGLDRELPPLIDGPRLIVWALIASPLLVVLLGVLFAWVLLQ
jgi:hypothetical protein